MTEPDLPELLTIRDLERVTGRSRQWIMSRAHYLPCTVSRITGWPKVAREDVREWLAAAKDSPETRQRTIDDAELRAYVSTLPQFPSPVGGESRGSWQ